MGRRTALLLALAFLGPRGLLHPSSALAGDASHDGKTASGSKGKATWVVAGTAAVVAASRSCLSKTKKMEQIPLWTLIGASSMFSWNEFRIGDAFKKEGGESVEALDESEDAQKQIAALELAADQADRAAEAARDKEGNAKRHRNGLVLSSGLFLSFALGHCLQGSLGESITAGLCLKNYNSCDHDNKPNANNDTKFRLSSDVGKAAIVAALAKVAHDAANEWAQAARTYDGRAREYRRLAADLKEKLKTDTVPEPDGGPDGNNGDYGGGGNGGRGSARNVARSRGGGERVRSSGPCAKGSVLNPRPDPGCSCRKSRTCVKSGFSGLKAGFSGTDVPRYARDAWEKMGRDADRLFSGQGLDAGGVGGDGFSGRASGRVDGWNKSLFGKVGKGWDKAHGTGSWGKYRDRLGKGFTNGLRAAVALRTPSGRPSLGGGGQGWFAGTAGGGPVRSAASGGAPPLPGARRVLRGASPRGAGGKGAGEDGFFDLEESDDDEDGDEADEEGGALPDEEGDGGGPAGRGSLGDVHGRGGSLWRIITTRYRLSAVHLLRARARPAP